MVDTNDKHLTPKQAAEKTGISVDVIRLLLRFGVIQGSKHSGRWHINEPDITKTLYSVLGIDDKAIRPARPSPMSRRQALRAKPFLKGVLQNLTAAGILGALAYLNRQTPVSTIESKIRSLNELNLIGYSSTLHSDFIFRGADNLAWDRAAELKIISKLFKAIRQANWRISSIDKISGNKIKRDFPCAHVRATIEFKIEFNAPGKTEISHRMGKSTLEYYLTKTEQVWSIIEEHEVAS